MELGDFGARGPGVVVVAVEVGAHGARAGVGLAVLAPAAIRVAAQVVLQAIGVDHGDDPDASRVHDVGDALAEGRGLAVLAGQQLEDVEGHLGRQVLTGVMQPIEHDLGLALVGADVVADLRREDGPALVAVAEGEDTHDVRVRGLGIHERLDHLGVAVIPRVLRRDSRSGPRRQARSARSAWRAARASRASAWRVGASVPPSPSPAGMVGEERRAGVRTVVLPPSYRAACRLSAATRPTVADLRTRPRWSAMLRPAPSSRGT